jgi:hypothetical protein
MYFMMIQVQYYNIPNLLLRWGGGGGELSFLRILSLWSSKRFATCGKFEREKVAYEGKDLFDLILGAKEIS